MLLVALALHFRHPQKQREKRRWRAQGYFCGMDHSQRARMHHEQPECADARIEKECREEEFRVLMAEKSSRRGTESEAEEARPRPPGNFFFAANQRQAAAGEYQSQSVIVPHSLSVPSPFTHHLSSCILVPSTILPYPSPSHRPKSSSSTPDPTRQHFIHPPGSPRAHITVPSLAVSALLTVYRMYRTLSKPPPARPYSNKLMKLITSVQDWGPWLCIGAK